MALCIGQMAVRISGKQILQTLKREEYDGRWLTLQEIIDDLVSHDPSFSEQNKAGSEKVERAVRKALIRLKKSLRVESDSAPRPGGGALNRYRLLNKVPEAEPHIDDMARWFNMLCYETEEQQKRRALEFLSEEMDFWEDEDADLQQLYPHDYIPAEVSGFSEFKKMVIASFNKNFSISEKKAISTFNRFLKELKANEKIYLYKTRSSSIRLNRKTVGGDRTSRARQNRLTHFSFFYPRNIAPTLPLAAMQRKQQLRDWALASTSKSYIAIPGNRPHRTSL